MVQEEEGAETTAMSRVIRKRIKTTQPNGVPMLNLILLQKFLFARCYRGVSFQDMAPKKNQTRQGPY
jgi:hypothetical protein